MCTEPSKIPRYTIRVGTYQETVIGLTEAEYRRKQALPRRALVATDIPGTNWEDRYGALLVREDGVIVPPEGDIELGIIQAEGRVFWMLNYWSYFEDKAAWTQALDAIDRARER
ncbi:hypothetical protein PSP6_690113 [Paraburkholderia tropica]|uniref:hypothetical protein n=1 Tax=Paraburkholderia tropica TaxID=92647 RepID=UPI001CB54EDA|nr:hypothetical protein [Paraburkholderia tropica]CAG9235972.1 hypothetical protein PSP6_690113 [Paraburkholderia tropica]